MSVKIPRQAPPPLFPGLYPTIAISDCWTVFGHAYASHLCLERGDVTGAVGFGMVALAASVGVLRFGFSERLASLNATLAETGAFVGLPLVGLNGLRRVIARGPAHAILDNSFFFLSLLVVNFAFARALPTRVAQLHTIITNLVLFIGPVVAAALITGQTYPLYGAALFVVAGVAVKSHEPLFKATLFGVCRENWFHYLIGTAALLVGLRTN